MLEQFKQFLISKNFTELSSDDYSWRISKIIEKEGITIEQLSANINKYVELYGKSGEKWSTGKRSHESVINSLKQFRKFVLVSRFGNV